MIWILIRRLLLVGLGIAIGITLMCLIQISKCADEKMKQIQRRNDE
ncbi:DUF3789 domain-containing protein [Clostridium sp. UBA1056]